MDGLELLLTMSFFLPLGLVAVAALATYRGAERDFPRAVPPVAVEPPIDPELECCAPADLPWAA